MNIAKRKIVDKALKEARALRKVADIAWHSARQSCYNADEPLEVQDKLIQEARQATQAYHTAVEAWENVLSA